MANLRALGEVQRRGLEAANQVIGRLVEQTERSAPLFGAEPPGGRFVRGGPLGRPVRAVRRPHALGRGGDVRRRVGRCGRPRRAPRPRRKASRPTRSASIRWSPGASASGELWLHNRSGADVGGVRLHCGDLRTHDGWAIPADHVTFAPDRRVRPSGPHQPWDRRLGGGRRRDRSGGLPGNRPGREPSRRVAPGRVGRHVVVSGPTEVGDHRNRSGPMTALDPGVGVDVEGVLRSHGQRIHAVLMSRIPDGEPDRWLYDLVRDYPAGRPSTSARRSAWPPRSRSAATTSDVVLPPSRSRCCTTPSWSTTTSPTAACVDGADRRCTRAHGVGLALNAGDALAVLAQRTCCEALDRYPVAVADRVAGRVRHDDGCAPSRARRSSSGGAATASSTSRPRTTSTSSCTRRAGTRPSIRCASARWSGRGGGPTSRPMVRFGFYLGAAFQIRDDLLNLIGAEARVRQGDPRRPARGQADADADPPARGGDARRAALARPVPAAGPVPSAPTRWSTTSTR